MMETLGFGLVAAVIVVSALFVVCSRNLVHAVLWLALALLGTSGMYALLDAPFLAGVQVLTYVGGVVTLSIFGVMVTRRHEGVEAAAESYPGLRGAATAGVLFAVLATAIWRTDFPVAAALPPTVPVSELAHALLDEYLLPFEAASLLLLVAIVGAVVLVRRRDPDPATGREPSAAESLGGTP